MFVTADSTTVYSLHGFYIKGIDANHRLPLQQLLLRHRHTSAISVTHLKSHAKRIKQLLPNNVKYVHVMDIAARCMGYHGWREAALGIIKDHRGMEFIPNVNEDLLATDTNYLRCRDIVTLFNTKRTDIPFDFTQLKEPLTLLDGYGWDQTLKIFENTMAVYTLPVNYTILRSQVKGYLTWLCRDLIEHGVYAHRVSKHPFIHNDELIK